MRGWKEMFKEKFMREFKDSKTGSVHKQPLTTTFEQSATEEKGVPCAKHSTNDMAAFAAVVESNSNSFDEQQAAIGDENEPPTTIFKQSAMTEKSADSEEQLNHDMVGFSAGGESNSNSIDEQQAAVWG